MRNFHAPGRSLVLSRGGMAATSHPLSTLTAVNVLQQGGNAIDAAIAACAVQCVVEPGSTGIGGDCFVLLAPAGSGKVIAFNGSGRAPRAATTDWYRERGITQIERQSPHAVTVPGAVDAWATLLKDHGTRSLGEVLRPAIRLAREGYAITPRVALDWASEAALLRRDPHARRIFLPNDAPPAVGAVHHQSELADTLEAIGEGGRDAFYTGALAADMVEYLQSLGGLHTLDDFAAARGAYVTPIKTTFRGYDVYECPPNGQGIIALLILNILAGLKGPADPLSADRLHQEIEATRLAYSVRDAMLADPAAAAVPVERLLSEAFARDLRDRIDLSRVIDPLPTFTATEHRDTVYITVVDKDRNAVSFINSIFHPYGSGLVSPRSGVLFHNRGQSFVIEPGHPNTIAPDKRPLHTIIPGLVMREGRACMPFGVMGGHYQAMGHAHLLSKVFDYGLDLQAAIDLPRVFPRPGTRVVEVENTLPGSVAEELRRRGFELVPPPRPTGGAQAIWIDWESGVLAGASDPRKDGCALGY